MSLPLVTVLIPARNEHDDIAGCLEAVLAQDYPHQAIEVVVVDGGSTDGTGARARAVLERRGACLHRHAVVENPAGDTPSNLNRGLLESTGAILCRVDARSVVPSDYVRRCVEVLEQRPEVAVVGGAQVARARGSGPIELGIARALNNRFGMGLARYRRGGTSGPTDTVYLGSFRVSDLREVGGWDERFATNQDFELNRRLGRRGQVWFLEGLEVGYLPRRTLRELAAQFHRFGRWKVRYWRTSADRPQLRQVLLLATPVVASAAAVGWWRLARRPVRHGVPLVVVAAAGFELAGPSGPPAGPRAHAVSLAASVAVAAGWITGVWRELLTRGGG